MSHFTLAEFSASDTATRLQIDNALPEHLLPNAESTLLMMERIRAQLCQLAGRDVPIRISSGYRCLALNWALKSASTSDHVSACAVDWTAPAFGSPYEICLVLLRHQAALGIGQLIHEYGRWVHTSTKRAAAINAAITITHAGVQAGILEA
jgi:zinc D-Ala-D-Ala carboxypeptidase